MRSRSIYDRTWRRQYVYVAATLPAEGGRSVATDLKRLQPDAVRTRIRIGLLAKASVLDSVVVSWLRYNHDNGRDILAFVQKLNTMFANVHSTAVRNGSNTCTASCLCTWSA